MSARHTFFENIALTRQASLGSAVGVFAGGTGAPIFAGDFANHAIIFAGTVGNTGTLWAYGATTSTGGGTAVLGSVPFGSSSTGQLIFDIRTDTLATLGTAYAYLSGGITVDAGGTLTGALFIASYNPRFAGTTSAAFGYSAVGTSLV